MSDLEKKLLSQELNNIEKFSILNDLREAYFEIDIDKSLDYAEKSLALAKSGKNKKNIASSLSYLGSVYIRKSNFQKALEYNKKALSMLEEIQDEEGIAQTLSHMGVNYSRLGNYQEALKINLRALDIEEKLGDKLGIAQILNNTGILYKLLRNYDKAQEFNFRGLAIFKEIKSLKGESYAYNNIGIIYGIQENYDKALEYYFSSLKINKQINDLHGIANSYNNIGICYQNLKQIEKSIEYFQSGLKIRKDMGDERGIAILKVNMANNYLLTNKNELALQESLTALEIAKKIEMKPLIKDSYQMISRVYSSKKDYERALNYYILFSELKDSIYSEESNIKIAEMRTKYETEKKEKEAEIFRLKNVELKEEVSKRTEELRNTNIKLKNEIIEHKKAEEQIKKDLEEKKILLQELYHRTKNNMQLISSMLKMQSEYSKNEFVHSTFKTINNRIKAMSLVQQKLYQAKDLSFINLKEYIEDIAALLNRSYSSPSKNISCELDVSEVYVLIDSAVPLGLVLNEIISNSFKHAFPDKRDGKIKIFLRKDDNQTINIKIEDNGTGFVKDFNPREAETIGFQTVFTLVEYQLHGKINLENHKGVKWKISFRDDQHIRRI